MFLHVVIKTKQEDCFGHYIHYNIPTKSMMSSLQTKINYVGSRLNEILIVMMQRMVMNIESTMAIIMLHPN